MRVFLFDLGAILVYIASLHWYNIPVKLNPIMVNAIYRLVKRIPLFPSPRRYFKLVTLEKNVKILANNEIISNVVIYGFHQLQYIRGYFLRW